MRWSRKNLFEFIQQIQNRNIEDIEAKEDNFRHYCDIITAAISPSTVILSFFEKNQQNLRLFLSTAPIEETEDFSVKIDEFDQENPYVELILSGRISWTKAQILPYSKSIRKYISENNISEAIIAPIQCKEIVIGFLTVLIPTTSSTERDFAIIENISRLLSATINNWMKYQQIVDKQQQTDIIIELSELTLATTELSVILGSILRKIQQSGDINNIGFFMREIDKFSLIQGVEISREMEEFYSAKDLKLNTLEYFNTPSIIKEQSLSLEDDQYALILPVGSTNLLLGFLLVISKPKKNFSDSTLHFLRIITNQLFITVQRKRLLDDIQAITQTSELSSFPVVLIDKSMKTIYLNSQSEKTFGIKHNDAVGVLIEDLFNIDSKTKITIEDKIKDVLENLNKNSLRLNIDIFEAGKADTHIFFVQLSPAINNLTGEYCVAATLVDITEATKLQELAEEYSSRTKMYLNVLTHDIFNILFAIGGYHEFIKNDLPPAHVENVNKVLALVKRGTTIVQDMRMLSRVMDTSATDEIVLIPLRMTLTTVIEKIKMEMIDQSVVINNDIPNMVRVMGGTYTSYIFDHIISKGIGGARSEKARYDLDGEEILIDDKPFFKLRIHDAEGMSPETRKTIEKAFQTSILHDNTGKHLWLAVAKEIAKKYGYLFEIKNRDNEDYTKGTDYIIRMPMN